MPIMPDTIYAQIADAGLCKALREAADFHGVTIDVLVQQTLLKCQELDLLKRVFYVEPLDKSLTPRR